MSTQEKNFYIAAKFCPKCHNRDTCRTWESPIDPITGARTTVNKCNTCGHEFDTIDRGKKFKFAIINDKPAF